MTIEHGSYVTVYDRNGNLETRGHIVGINRSNPPYYDVQPMRDFTMAKRINGIPAALIRKVYGPSRFVEPKHIYDEA